LTGEKATGGHPKIEKLLGEHGWRRTYGHEGVFGGGVPFTCEKGRENNSRRLGETTEESSKETKIGGKKLHKPKEKKGTAKKRRRKMFQNVPERRLIYW